MNELQRQNILKQLDRLLAQAATDEEFDALDDVRSAVKRWDLQGSLPHETELRSWGIDPEAALHAAPDEAAPEAPSSLRPVLSEHDADQILKALLERLKATAPDTPHYEALKSVRKTVKEWHDAGRTAPLPHDEALANWGIWPPALDPEPVAPPEPEPLPDPDTALMPEYQTACSLIAGQPYQAIQRLTGLQGRAQGSLAERLAVDLDAARVELQQRTEALIIAARGVQQQRRQDLAAQAEAWRAVTTLNPESLEAQEALQRLQQRVRAAIEDEMQRIEQKAHGAAARDHLPDLNAARGAAEALTVRPDLSQDLQGRVQALADMVLRLLAATRDRLGVASTMMVQGDLRESYRLARESLDKGSPKLVDFEGVLVKAGEEVDAGEFFRVVSGGFLAATGKKVEERLSGARATKRAAPDAALERLHEARDWLTDKVWTKDHRESLKPQLEEVEREIEDIERLLKRFLEARDMVIQARASGLAARERLHLLNEAQQLYPDYPNIQAYLEEVQDNLAGELAGVVEAQIAEAQRLTFQERFPDALQMLKEARAEALRDVPAPKAGSPLALALVRVAQEETAVAVAEQALRDLEALLAQVEAKLAAYDADKNNLLPLNEARVLLEQVPELQRQHPKTQEARSRVAARQGEAENYSAGKDAYGRRDWAGACDYFHKVTPVFDQYAEAQRLSKRARAALAAEKAQQAETDKDWKTALHSYEQAVYLFEEAGDDGMTAGIATACREAKRRIEENDQRFRRPLEEAQQRLEKVSVLEEHAPLRDRLDPIPEFKAIVEVLEPLIRTPSALSAELKTTLHRARQAWRQAFLPALETAAQDTMLGVELLSEAVRRAAELKAAGLLYSQDEENLYCQLFGKQLDVTYARLVRAEIPDWAAIEQNRRARLDLPVVENSPDHQLQWATAHRKRLESDIRAVREQSGVAAAQQFLGAQLRTGRLRAEVSWLRLWLELCWEAEDWDEAEHVADRLGALAADPQARRMKTALWLDLTHAAQAYAEDDIEGARSRLEAVRQQGFDEVVDEVEEFLEQQALRRLLDTAARERRVLDNSGPAVSPEQYFSVARAYGIALQLFPDDQVAQQGLAAISGRIEPVLQQRCQDVDSMYILRQDLEASRAAASRLLQDLKALEAIVGHLTLSDGAQSTLTAALENQEIRKARWDKAAAQLKHCQQLITEALSFPDPPRLDDLEHSGGWDFSAAQAVLKPLKVEASRARDKGLQELIEAELRRLDGYKESARELMQRARALLQAIRDEEFETVVSAVDDLRIYWEQLTAHEPAWGGLETVICYPYLHPPRAVDTLREHRDLALKQQANLSAWKLYEKDVSGLYAGLQEVERELLGDEFALLRCQKALRDIQAQCVSWHKRCDEFLKKLEQNAPQEPPLSAKAKEVRVEVKADVRKAHLNGDGGTRARIAELRVMAQGEEVAFQAKFERFRNFYNGLPHRVRTRRQLPSPGHIDLAQRLYDDCRSHDPRNEDLERLKKQLQVVGIACDQS
ncbi:MAG: hypothetical protein JXA21_13185 [Anaerolineae bacterium]|nr:hypothetical protein [Anaerolineae bacterium]